MVEQRTAQNHSYILDAFESRLRVQHTMQTNPAAEQNKNAKWSERPVFED